MNFPIPIETLQAELPADANAWVLQDQKTKKYVVIPHVKYPGRQIIHFFLKRDDAEKVLIELNDENPKLANANVIAVSVKLFPALQGIADNKNPENADGFVVHSPNEVYDFVNERS